MTSSEQMDAQVALIDSMYSSAGAVAIDRTLVGAAADDTLHDVIQETVGATSVSSETALPANHIPVVGAEFADQIATEGAAWRYTLPAGAFTDPDAGDKLTYSIRLVNGEALPAWLSFDAATGTFSGTPDAAAVGNLSVQVTATDTGGLSVSQTLNLVIDAKGVEPEVPSNHDSVLGTVFAEQSATEGTMSSDTVPTGSFSVSVGDEDVISGTGTSDSGSTADTPVVARSLSDLSSPNPSKRVGSIFLKQSAPS